MTSVSSTSLPQKVSTELDGQVALLEKHQEVAARLVDQPGGQTVKERTHAITERIQALSRAVSANAAKFAALQSAAEFQKAAQEHLVFLKEVRSRLEVEFCLDGVGDVENEISNVEVSRLTTTTTTALTKE